jgi:hypothetical protein
MLDALQLLMLLAGTMIYLEPKLLLFIVFYSLLSLIIKILIVLSIYISLSKGCHLDVVRGPSTPHDPESDAGGSLSSWQGHPSR